MTAEINRADVVERILGEPLGNRRGDEDLAAMAGVAEAGGMAQGDPEIVAGSLQRFARVDGDADAESRERRPVRLRSATVPPQPLERPPSGR